MAVAEDQIYSSLEAVAPDLGKQVATDNGKQIAFNRSELEVTAKVDFFTDQISAHPIQDHQPPSKKWIAMTGAAVSIVTLAVILGAVLGSRHTTPSKILGTQITNESAPPPHVSPPPPKRNIAAISFNHTFNHKSVNTDRVYFIDSQGNIMEAAKFEEGIAWQIGKIGTGAKIGSAIATSVSRPKFPLVYYGFPIRASIH